MDLRLRLHGKVPEGLLGLFVETPKADAEWILEGDLLRNALGGPAFRVAETDLRDLYRAHNLRRVASGVAPLPAGLSVKMVGHREVLRPGDSFGLEAENGTDRIQDVNVFVVDARFGVQAKHGQLSDLPEDEQARLFELTHRFLGEAGWPAYEVSNFARGEAHQSRHNRKYWDHTPYLGLGPSAHSLAASDVSPSACRWWNERGTPRWEKRLAAGERPIEAQELLGLKDLAEEALLLGLRTTSGIDLDAFRTRFGVDLLAANDTLVARLADEDRIVVRSDEDAGRWLVPTLSGLAVADGLAAAFDLSVPS